MPDKFVAVALAGGLLEDDFRQAGYDVINKAYLRVGGSSMLERVLRALVGAESVSHIRCVTQPDAFRAAFGDPSAMGIEVISPGRDLMESALAGIAGLDEQQTALLCATDIPLATSAAVDAFAAKVAAVECDIGYGYVNRIAHERAFPSVRHTWVRLREGTFCGSGISAVRVGAAPPLAAMLRKVVAARKSPLKIAALFSPGLLLRLPFGAVSVTDLERRGSEISGVRCRGIECDDPELAVNVDRLEDLREVEALLGRI